MASVTELAYTIVTVKQNDFSPIFQSFKNKNKCSSMERSWDHKIVISLDNSHSSTYFKTPQPSPLTVV